MKADQGCLAYAGLAPDLFATDGAGFGAFRKALWSENRFAPEAFQNRQNFFGGNNVTAIVLEVPSSLIGRGVVHAWATASLYGHAPEVQVSRWGLPMITHVLLSDPSLHDASENYNRAIPADEVRAVLSKPIRDFVEKVRALAHSAADPSAYATQLLARLCPSVLPYELDTPASFSFAAFNGRGLCDDVMDVILTLVTNTALGDGVAPRYAADAPGFSPISASRTLRRLVPRSSEGEGVSTRPTQRRPAIGWICSPAARSESPSSPVKRAAPSTVIITPKWPK